MRRAALLAVVGSLALPSTALADKWVGKTNQGLRGVVETNQDGTIKIVKINARTNCRRSDFSLRGPTSWTSTEANPIEHALPAFSDSGPFDLPPERGWSVTGTHTLAGRFLADGRVAVRQTVEATVFRRGRKFDTCKGTVRFTGKKR